jgi:4'-phosphopantetheinyl transferase
MNCHSEAPSPAAFPVGRVDVWTVHLDESAREGFEAGILSYDENARASRFHFEKDREHFIQCRSALRSLLGGYLGIAAAEIGFEYSSSGKPRIAAGQNPRGLQFNVSHSANMALIAVGSEHRLGIDIEQIRSGVAIESLAERFFSLRERAGLRALPDALRVPGFFACWTRKEAFLKATGEGLSFPLADFSVSTHPELDPAVEEIRGNTEAAKQWFLADLSVDAGFRTAVIVERPFMSVETHSWN